MKLRPERSLDRLAEVQHRRAGTITVLSIAVAAAAMPLVLQLGLDSSWTALLPEDAPSVRDLEEIEDRVGGLNTLTIAIQSDEKNVDAMQRLADDLVPRLRTLPDRLASSVEWNISAYEDFVWQHRHLYANLDDLHEVRDALKERLRHEKAEANPFYVDLTEEKPPDPSQVVERMRRRANKAKEKAEQYPGGYYIHPDRDMLVLFIRSSLGGGNAAEIQELLSGVRTHVRELEPTSYGEDLHVELAGNLVLAREEHEAIARELVLATALTVSGVLLVIFVFFRRFRAIPLIGGALAVPVLTTFAFAELAVDFLNTSTAFLGSIVVGNGINPTIIWLARYFEDRRRGLDVAEALPSTHRSTWNATLTASLAAALAYASLIITDFRGFRDFGIIGGFGMIACWIGAILVLPAMVVLFERWLPFTRKETHEPRRTSYGVWFAKAVHNAPRSIVVVSAVLGVAAIGLIAYALHVGPLEYDFRNLKSVREGSTTAKQVNDKVGDFVSSSQQGNGIAVVVEEREQARWLEGRLETLREEENAPWGEIHTIFDLLPDAQDQKIDLLAEIRELLHEVRPHIKDEDDLAAIDEHMPPANPSPVQPADLPARIARPFTETDGTRGRILVVGKKLGVSIWDGRYLVRWAEALREVRLPNGERPPLAGRAPVFADMIATIWTAGPKAIAASFTATFVLLMFAFAQMRRRLLTLMSLLLGIAWMGGAMTVAQIKLNFLNFVAFPITFGNGVDYGVNVMRRYVLEDDRGNPEAVGTAVEGTGGAVILCSLTTIIGYTSLYTSANLALNSFGIAMAISEVTCLLAAVLTMPAVLVLRRRRR